MPEPEVKYNQDELVPPTFLNQDFIITILKSVEEDPKLKLLHHEIKPGSNAGDHYASIMFKIIVNYETNGRSVEGRRFILKTFPESGEKKDFLEDLPVFTNEVRMYTKILPAMENIIKQHEEIPFWPRMVYHSIDPPTLVFDDLTQENFSVIYETFTMCNIGIMVEKIATYHALSMVVAESDQSDLITSCAATFTPEKLRPMFENMINEAKYLGTTVQTWPGMKDIGVKIEKHIDKIFHNFAECYVTPNPRFFKVLNHGDFHIRNMMFRKSSNGALEEVRFLDFQLPLYNTPAYDLVYMLNAMAAGDVRERRFELYKKYHVALVDKLKRFEYKGRVPSLIDLNVEILHMSRYDAFQCLAFLPVFRVDLKGVELSELFNKSEDNPMRVAMRKLYKEAPFIKELTGTLTYLDNMGVFDL